MPASGIQYAYCPAAPAQCASIGGGDFAFTAGQIASMQNAFSAWINAKSANGSNLSFNRIFTSTYGTDPFQIAIRSMSTSAMGTALARFTTQGMELMDFNNDGAGDAVRLADAILEVRTNVTTQLTAAFVHEIGHTFGLEECPSCTASSTVMKTPISSSQLTAPSACDNAKVASIM